MAADGSDVYVAGKTIGTFPGQTSAGGEDAFMAKLTVSADSDGDGILDADDACPTTPGLADRQGCPVGDANTVVLHQVVA